jgi:hypothetical protein
MALVSALHFFTNGVIGFVAWMARDVRVFVCRAMLVGIPAVWIGYLLGVTRGLALVDVVAAGTSTQSTSSTVSWGLGENEDTEMGNNEEQDDADNEPRYGLIHTHLRLCLGCLMVSAALMTAIGSWLGGVNRYCCPSRSGGAHGGVCSICHWILYLACSCSTGYFFLATIGSGAAITMFLAMSVILGVETKRAMPTAIVIAGWASVLPFIDCFIYNTDSQPYIRLLMILPGIW